MRREAQQETKLTSPLVYGRSRPQVSRQKETNSGACTSEWSGKEKRSEDHVVSVLKEGRVLRALAMRQRSSKHACRCHPRSIGVAARRERIVGSSNGRKRRRSQRKRCKQRKRHERQQDSGVGRKWREGEGRKVRGRKEKRRRSAANEEDPGRPEMRLVK